MGQKDHKYCLPLWRHASSHVPKRNCQTSGQSEGSQAMRKSHCSLHGSKLPVSSSITVISRHYYPATEIKEHVRINVHLPSPNYKHFPSTVFFLVLDSHFSSSLTPKPRPPQPPSKLHSLTSFIPVGYPCDPSTALPSKPGLPPSYPSYLTTA